VNEKEIRFIEMFCGVGGFRLGLEGINRKANRKSQANQKTDKKQGLESEKRKGIDTKTRQSNEFIDSKSNGRKFTCIWANDNDKYACQVYRERFGNKELVEGDIRNIRTKSIPDHNFLTAGFPCQSFSIAGRREGFQDKTRGTLFWEILRVLRDKRPSYLLLENVKGLLSHEQGRTFAIILLSLDELGYDVEWQVLNTKYWLPQNRERVFIFGIRRKGG